MNALQLPLPGLALLCPRRFEDDRGFFVETYSRRAFAAVAGDTEFVQDNLSHSREAGTVRGLHYQRPPAAQAKLVSVLRGRILDVAVDVRRGSPTFGEHVAVELSADGGEQLFVPVGFLHGFMTLEPDTMVAYKVTAFYAPECDGAVRFDDPTLAIDWPVPASGVRLSPKDAAAPAFADFVSPFAFAAEQEAI